MSIKLPEGIGFTAADFNVGDGWEGTQEEAAEQANAKLPALFEAFMRCEYEALFAKQVEWNKELTRELFEAWVKREGVKVYGPSLTAAYWSKSWEIGDTHEAYLVLPRELAK